MDKMLTDLKSLNDLNAALRLFLDRDKEESRGSNGGEARSDVLSFAGALNVQAPLPTYQDYVESFDLNKNEVDVDQYLKVTFIDTT